MPNHRFSSTTSNVILGTLVVIACGILWFAMQAYAEIAEIAPSAGVQALMEEEQRAASMQRAR